MISSVNDASVNFSSNSLGQSGGTKIDMEVPQVEFKPVTSADTNQKSNNETEHQESDTYTEKEVYEAIESANKKVENTRTEFEFSIHEETKRIMVKVKDKDTQEVIMELPPEKILDAVASVWEMAGIFVDEKV